MNRDLQARIIEAQNGDKNVLNDLHRWLCPAGTGR